MEDAVESFQRKGPQFFEILSKKANREQEQEEQELERGRGAVTDAGGA